MKNFILVIALILFSIPVFSSEWSDEVKVAQIIAGHKEGFILFRTAGS